MKLLFYTSRLFSLCLILQKHDALINIYQKQGNLDAEKEMLIKAISGCKDNGHFKKRLDELNKG